MVDRGGTLALCAAFSFVLGLGAGLLFSREIPAGARATAAQVPAASPAEDAGELAASLRTLERTLGQLAVAIEHARAPGLAPENSAERRDAASGPPAPESKDLATALQVLAAALRKLDSGSKGDARRSPELFVPVFVDRESAFGGMGMRQAARSENDEVFEAAQRTLGQKHLFWTMQQVLNAYGKPDSVEIEGPVISWTYRNSLGEEASEEYWFYFREGLVHKVEYGYEGP